MGLATAILLKYLELFFDTGLKESKIFFNLEKQESKQKFDAK